MIIIFTTILVCSVPNDPIDYSSMRELATTTAENVVVEKKKESSMKCIITDTCGED